MSEKLEIQAASDPESNLRYAIDRNASVDVIERMMVIRRELQAEKAKAAYDSAMAAFQAACPVITKEKGVPDRSGTVAYFYSPFEDIIAKSKDCRESNKFSFELNTDLESQPGWVIAVCTVTHGQGHSRTSKAKFPLGTKTGIMSDTQVYAAALTFASRRAFCNAFGIVTAGEDSDGRIGKPKPAGPSTVQPDNIALKALASEIWKLLKPVRGAASNWDEANKWLWREEILDAANPDDAMPHLLASRMNEVLAKVKEKLA